MKGFLLAAGAALAYSIFRTAEGVKTLDYEVQNVRIHKWNIAQPGSLELRAVIRFTNPSSVRYTVDSVRLNVYHAGTIVADSFRNAPIVIEAKQASIQEFPLTLRLLPVLSKLVPLLKDKKALPAVDVQGFINVGGVDQKITARVNLADYDPRNALPKPANKTKVEPAPRPAPPGGSTPAATKLLPVPRTPLADTPAPASRPTAKPAAKSAAKPARKATAKKTVQKASTALKSVSTALNPFLNTTAPGTPVVLVKKKPAAAAKDKKPAAPKKLAVKPAKPATAAQPWYARKS